MFRFTLMLALGVLPVFGGGRVLHFAPVTLYTQFQQAPPAVVEEAIETELANIMLPAGITFEWHPLDEAGGRVSAQLAIIHFKGECDAEDLRPEWGYPGPLGWTHISDGEILPFIDINCEGVRLFTQRELLDIPAANRDAVYGRAIARVLAHELYHLLVHTKIHAASGVAKAAYSVGELLSRTLQFGNRECEALRARRAQLAMQPEAAGEE